MSDLILPYCSGKIYTKELDSWKISWESDDLYRYWCHSEHVSSSKSIIIVGFNPGSLKSNGTNLNKDTTLRVLRDTFADTGYNPFVINLYDYADPKREEVYNHWDIRGEMCPVVNQIDISQFSGVIYAWGDWKYSDKYDGETKDRIDFIRIKLSSLSEIETKMTSSGNPQHPYRWPIVNMIQFVKEQLYSLPK